MRILAVLATLLFAGCASHKTLEEIEAIRSYWRGGPRGILGEAE